MQDTDAHSNHGNHENKRVRVSIYGAVQGVGFRPFIYRLAKELHLKGWVYNSGAGVTIEVEAPLPALETFLERIHLEKPQHSFIQNFQYAFLDPEGFSDFEIRKSDESEEKTVLVLPDIATCSECLKDIFNPKDPRYLYPFTNCTHCGPRYSIIESLPYDRANTSMKGFPICRNCQREYEDPSNRRFHAQPNACPECGPHLELWDSKGNVLGIRHEALILAIEALKEGKIVAAKGLGGFHLFVDAQSEESVQMLRKRKHREEKPFALMFPTLDSIEAQCEVSDKERAILLSGESPIVLLAKRPKVGGDIAVTPAVAPRNPNLGVMLPYTPLHHTLMRELQFPVVATSGNLSDEPICINERDALERLEGIADVFLIHDRPIVRSVDDSVVRIMMDRPLVLRRSRGYAPLPVSIKEQGSSVLAVGGHLKNTIALSIKENVFISQHIGDLETAQSLTAFEKTIESIKELYEPSEEYIVCDMHPEYISTKAAHEMDLPVIAVQHHHAHIVSCMAENQVEGDVLGIAWDGTGYGTDKTIWGGEFLHATLTDFTRVGYFKPFRIPGGDKAIKEPRRTALGLLIEMFKGRITDCHDLATIKAFDVGELKTIQQMLNKGLNSPETSSVGRLFDAVASLIGLHQYVRFEGQAAMELEYALKGLDLKDSYDFEVVLRMAEEIDSVGDRSVSEVFIADWRGIISGAMTDIRNDVSRGEISIKFHNTLIEIAVEMAKKMKLQKVVLSGGCFQNKYLTEHLIGRLREEGFSSYWHQLVPPNDGGISLGQAVVGMCRTRDSNNKLE